MLAVIEHQIVPAISQAGPGVIHDTFHRIQVVQFLVRIDFDFQRPTIQETAQRRTDNMGFRPVKDTIIRITGKMDDLFIGHIDAMMAVQPSQALDPDVVPPAGWLDAPLLLMTGRHAPAIRRGHKIIRVHGPPSHPLPW